MSATTSSTVPSTVQFNIEELEKPMAITVGNVVYLGHLKEETNKIVVVNAVAIETNGEITAGHLAYYCEQALSGNFGKISVHGNSQVASQELNQDLDLSWEITILKLKKALVAGPVNAVIAAFNKGS